MGPDQWDLLAVEYNQKVHVPRDAESLWTMIIVRRKRVRLFSFVLNFFNCVADALDDFADPDIPDVSPGIIDDAVPAVPAAADSPIPIMPRLQKKNPAAIQRTGMTEQQLKALASAGRTSPVTTTKRKIDDVLSGFDNNKSNDSFLAVSDRNILYALLVCLFVKLDDDV